MPTSTRTLKLGRGLTRKDRTVPTRGGAGGPGAFLLSNATWYVDARSYSGTGDLLDLSPNALNAQLGSVAGADTNDPLWLPHTGTDYVYLPGVAGNALTTPHAANQVPLATQTLKIEVDVAMADWTPAAESVLFSKEAGDPGHYYKLLVSTGGALQFASYSAGTGASQVPAVSTANLSAFAAGARCLVKCEVLLDNGAGGRTCSFFYSTDTDFDTATWTQLGAAVTGAATTYGASGSTAITLGGLTTAASLSTGNLYKARLTIGGTVVASFNAADINTPYASGVSSVTGETWTVNRSSSGRKTAVVDRPMFLFGTDDYMEVADNALLDFAAADSFTLVAAFRKFGTGTAFDVLVKDTSAGSVGYRLWAYTDDNLYFTINDGALNVQQSVALSVGSTQVGVGVRSDADSNVGVSVNSSTLATFNDGTTLTLANSVPLRIGGADVSPLYAAMEFMGAAIFRRALTAAEIARVVAEFQ